MDYKQFMKLMEPGELPGKDSINTLQEFVNEFPYFQSAHILLAKSMHEQQHVRYERQLKIAAAYAGDRKTLYNLIHSKVEKQNSQKPIVREIETVAVPEERARVVENIFIEKEKNYIVPPFDDEIENVPASEENFESIPPAIFYREPVETIESENEEIKEKIAEDPHDIIRKRLNEILGLKKEEEEKPIPTTFIEKKAVSNDEVQSQIDRDKKANVISAFNEIEKHVPTVDEDVLSEAAKPKNEIDLAQMESALETSIIQSLENLPVIQKTIVPEKETVSDNLKNEHSFYDWLKIKSTEGYGRIEEVHADDVEIIEPAVGQSSTVAIESVEELPEKSAAVNQLIDRFLESDPKIVPSKKEFYSPANQAKKSVTENEDLVSETLARIYHQQGNFQKARSSYQRLSLLYPEKMAYFAALISEVEKAINNLDKQDL